MAPQIRGSLPGIQVSAAHLLSLSPEDSIASTYLICTWPRGIGTAWTPIRLHVSPEVVLLTLK